MALPFRLFADEPAWVPPLRLSVHQRISPRHPAAAHQETALWLAFRGRRPVGRLGACVDRAFNDYQGLPWCWVGFFESLDDPEAARALFDTAAAWAADRGADQLVGPASFTTNDECGLLVEGFEHPPLILTPHNPAYYERLWVGAGWEPAIDLWGWYFDRTAPGLSDRQRRVLQRLRDRAQVNVRSMRMQDFEAEVGRFFEVYNAAWSRNWGFAPMPEAEIRHLARQLKQVLEPELALVAERAEGEPLAVALALRDTNEAMTGLRNGRLLPIGWLRLLRGVPRARRARIMALGVRPEAQALGLGPLLYDELYERLRAMAPLEMVEASWILATNDRMNDMIEAAGGRRYKTWRIYQRPVGPPNGPASSPA